MTVLKGLCNFNLEPTPFWPMVGHSETLFMMEKKTIFKEINSTRKARSTGPV